MSTERKSVWYSENPAPEMLAYTREVNDVAILPIGAIEQHGPHCPLGSDALNAIGIVEKAAEKSGATALAPCFYGSHPHHHWGMPGNIPLTFETHIGLLTDIVACPGGDLCALANAKSVPVAEGIQRRFDDMDYVHDLGPLDINISGCMNACGHHHIGHIGILGVDKKGKEFYQITLGGRGDKLSRIGEKMGPSFESHEVTDVIEKIINTYVDRRLENEPFIDTYERIGMEPFKEHVYG